MTEEKAEEKAEEKKEPEKNEEIIVAPVAGQQPPPMLLSERDAKTLVCELHDIGEAAVGAFNLPPTTNINRSANFYLDEMLRTLKEYNIIE